MDKSKKRRRYLINTKFQIKWTLIITLVGTLAAAFFSVALWYYIERQNTLLQEGIETDKTLKTKSEDLMIVLLNMPDRTEKEKQRYIKRLSEIDRRFETSRRNKAELMADNKVLKYLIVAFVVLIGVFLFAWGVFLTNKVAGPLYVIKYHLQQLEADGRVVTRPLRKGDEFQDDYETIRKILDKLSSG